MNVALESLLALAVLMAISFAIGAAHHFAGRDRMNDTPRQDAAKPACEPSSWPPHASTQANPTRADRGGAATSI